MEEPVIFAVGFVAEEVGDSDGEHGVFGELGHLGEGSTPGLEVGGGDHGRIKEQLDIVGRGAESLDRIAAEDRVGIQEGGLMDFAVEFA
ncbi:MAG: hypothetical protein RI897_630 [Verrucomicrobiota bacterium]